MVTGSSDNIATIQTTTIETIDTTDGNKASLQEQSSGAGVTDDKDISSDCEPHNASSSILLDNINTTSDLPSSLADSGHFEDMASSVSLHIHIYVFTFIILSFHLHKDYVLYLSSLV
jgi:hypothetical protein